MQDQLAAIDDLLIRRDVKKAEVQIAKVLRSATTPHQRAQVLLFRARARLLGARPEDALDDITAARSLDEEVAEPAALLELLGDSYFARFELASVGFADRGDTQRAINAYQEIVDQHPLYENIGWIYYQMGRVLLTENRTDEAVTCFRQGLLNPSRVPALTAYAFERLAFVAFYESRELVKALGFINKAVDTYPANEDRRWLVQVHILRSRVLRDMHRLGEALKAAETALSVAGNNTNNEDKLGLAEAMLTMGELLHPMEGRERDVINYLQQFLQLSKKPLGVDVTWSRVYEMLGDAFYKTGQHTAAVNAYQGALQFNPYNPWELSLHYRIARSYYVQGDYDRSIQALRRMQEVAHADGQALNDYRVYDMLGNALFALGRYDDAVESYRTALQMAPPNADNLDKIRTYHDFARELSRPL